MAGGIRTLTDAENILNAGADKISINSPALENPDFINQLSEIFGTQCVVIGIDSLKMRNHYHVYQYTGDSNKTQDTDVKLPHWIQEVQAARCG